MSRRSRAREIALQLLYQEDLNADQAEDVRLSFMHGRLQYNRKLIEFAKSLIEGVQQNRDAIDRALELTARNWRLSRMAATDRNVLRLGAYEILFGDTPRPRGRQRSDRISQTLRHQQLSPIRKWRVGSLDEIQRRVRSNLTSAATIPIPSQF